MDERFDKSEQDRDDDRRLDRLTQSLREQPSVSSRLQRDRGRVERTMMKMGTLSERGESGPSCSRAVPAEKDGERTHLKT